MTSNVKQELPYTILIKWRKIEELVALSFNVYLSIRQRCGSVYIFFENLFQKGKFWIGTRSQIPNSQLRIWMRIRRQIRIHNTYSINKLALSSAYSLIHVGVYHKIRNMLWFMHAFFQFSDVKTWIQSSPHLDLYKVMLRGSTTLDNPRKSSKKSLYYWTFWFSCLSRPWKASMSLEMASQDWTR
jgi:hypothetical protein